MIRVIRPIPVDRLRLLVWDLDGTLVDSREDLAHAINAMLRHLGRPELPLEGVIAYVGNGARTLVRRCLGDGALAEEAGLAFFLAHYRDHLLDRTRPYEGIPELLDALAARGLAHAVLTNKPLAHSEAILAGLGLRGGFQRVCGGDSFSTRKPHPEGALALLAELGVAPESALMIGDSDNDVLTARAAGMWSLGVDYGFSAHTFAEAEPDARVDTVGEIGALLGL